MNMLENNAVFNNFNERQLHPTQCGTSKELACVASRGNTLEQVSPNYGPRA